VAINWRFGLKNLMSGAQANRWKLDNGFAD